MTETILAWLLLFAPLVASGLILVMGRASKEISAGVAIGGAAVSLVCSWSLWLKGGSVVVSALPWMDFSYFGKEFRIPIGFLLDGLSLPMLVVVTTVALLVFVYSLGYMAKEEGYWRYFAGLSLFLFSMLGIVVADNFVMMFLFWELVGVSSYILIGHYYRRDSAADAAKQAFTVNRVGDFGFMLGILFLWLYSGTIFFVDLREKAQVIQEGMPWLLTLGLVLVFLGTVGKSAQFPLHVWLPNSMEGPTPVSSLLHAATMVAAGVYMLARIFPALSLSPDALEVIGWVGGVTCLLAALMGTQQNDIKRILAYSTISQLGYMIVGISVAAGAGVAIFHLFTHAFFKCLLFLAAGSVIVGMHHEQDIWKMGALKNKMPMTFVLMGVGAMALAGVPPFSGFFSKDLILEWAWVKGSPMFWLGAITISLTTFYIFRLYLVVFLGKPRSDAAKHAHESPKVMLIPMGILAVLSFVAGWPFVSKGLVNPEHPEQVPLFLRILLLGFLVLGAGFAFLLYGRGPEKDPIYIIFFERRLYIDDLYAWIVKNIQDRLAGICAFLDRWVIDGVVKVGSGFVWLFGFCVRMLQIGNIQAYTFYFGAGILLIFFLLLSK